MQSSIGNNGLESGGEAQMGILSLDKGTCSIPVLQPDLAWCRMFPSKIRPEHCPSLSSVFPELKLELGFYLFICFFEVVSFVRVT